ncbi:hypothetical protein CBR_g40368 [Chara braunii]|uniref:Uncharacterized protein n=1 Tax=Chara braunii TaxID=69332 RepID=A0A388LTQ5_CHABU|nr:hypothetical protein CBR_g40368 [Chara braunii]|eukprot:GBG85639.1 hypothetical protein CBR_g40368 [Chara braunii]
MLDCKAGLELESVRTDTRRGMTPEEIVRQVALITRDPIGVSAPPAAEAVFGRRASIFRPYPREDDSDEEPVPEAADHPALRIPREINETHLDPEEDTRAHTARRNANRAEREMMGGEEELWGPFGEVASTGGTGARATSPAPTRQESSMPPPSAPSPAPPSPATPYEPTTAIEDTEELASSLPQRRLLHGGGAVRQLRLRSPSPGVLQEEGGPSAAAVEGEMAVKGGLADTTIAGAAALDRLVAAAAGAAGGADAVEGGIPGAVEEEIGAQVEVSRGGGDERLMQQFLTEQYDPVMAGMTPGVARGLGMSDSQMGSHLDLDLSMGLPPSGGGATSTDRAPSRDDAAGESLTQPQRVTTTRSPDAARDILERERARLMASTNPRAQAFARALEDARCRETGGIVWRQGRWQHQVVSLSEVAAADSLEYALMTATRAVHEQTPRKRGVPPRPRPVPAERGDALGETSGAEGLGMPRGSRREQTVTEASARVVVLRKAGAPVTIEEDDPETDVAMWEEDEDYEGEEEGEEESERGSDGDYDHDEHEPPPPSPKGAARRRAAQTSSSSRGRRSSTSGTQGGTRRQSGKGKKRR